MRAGTESIVSDADAGATEAAAQKEEKEKELRSEHSMQGVHGQVNMS